MCEPRCLAAARTGSDYDAARLMVGDNFRHDIQGATDLGIGGTWLNRTHLPRPAAQRVYFEAHSFEQAAAHIRSLL